MTVLLYVPEDMIKLRILTEGWKLGFSGQAQRATTNIVIKERQRELDTRREGDVKTRWRQRPEWCGRKLSAAGSQQEPEEAGRQFSPGASRGRAAPLIP